METYRRCDFWITNHRASKTPKQENLKLQCTFSDMIRYDTIRIAYDTKEGLTWTQKLSDQLNLAHVARKKYEKKKLEQINASVHLVHYRFKIRQSSPEGMRMTMEEIICER